ncbi:DUF58 domain-containing protein [Dictyobacter kobayashii]|uniref:VWFA domain-containing protein n=1 Tax=Dictyobacter kobayashii TaxID=2014872 RepID=A0A402AUA3_9CHLR|nr:DUF58 domain-containing protein [Dictyobacter kobayashii]GCE22674.1 hypothetical protein KDK_64740 [Dictyobacter kobayashii]
MWLDKHFLKLFRTPSSLDLDTLEYPSQQQRATLSSSDQLLRRLNWRLLRPLASYLGGSEHSRFLGPGVEFSEIRAYQPGDDIRFIDWNISARTEVPMVREAYVERAADVWFLLDLSASTRWGTADCLKLDRALELTALAGQLLNRAGNRLGALLFAEKPLTIIPPAVGQQHLLQLLARIRQVPHDDDACAGTTDLVAALTKVQTVIRRRALVIIVSDFLVSAGWQGALGKLAQRHEVVAVRLLDPREGALPDVGLVTLEDPETGRQLFVDTSDARLRERFGQAALLQTEQLHTDLMKCGVELLQIRTDEETITSLVSFLQTRRARRLRQPWSRRAPVAVSGKGDI